MSNNRFEDFYSKFSTEALIEKLASHRNGTAKLGEDWYKALTAHLYERPLAEEEKRIVDEILSGNPEAATIKDRVIGNPKSFDSFQKSKPIANRSYPALDTISGVFIVFAWLAGIATVIVAIVSISKGAGGILLALPMIIGGAIAVLMLVATSELIKLFIDIEHNTRITANNTLPKL